MKNIVTNTFLILALSLLVYLPFSVYRFENIQDVASKEKVLSASTDSFGRYVSFGERKNVYAYETAVFKVFLDKQVDYTDFYTVTNSSNFAKQYDVLVINSDYLKGFNLFFTSNKGSSIIVKPNETVGISVNFEPRSVKNATLSFIIFEKTSAM